MRWMKWISFFAAVVLIISCYFTWVTIPGKNISISGVLAEGTRYGKPGYLNLMLTGVYILLTFIPRLWAKRVNIFVATLNFSWSLRNFVLLSLCEAGRCPDKQPNFYFYFIASIIMLIGALFTNTGKPVKSSVE